jgi:hypothetical protein
LYSTIFFFFSDISGFSLPFRDELSPAQFAVECVCSEQTVYFYGIERGITFLEVLKIWFRKALFHDIDHYLVNEFEEFLFLGQYFEPFLLH